LIEVVPNWCEITGTSKLRRLFKHIDANDSGYVTIDELFRVKEENVDEAENRQWWMQRLPAKKKRRWNADRLHLGDWNIKPQKSMLGIETFEASEVHHPTAEKEYGVKAKTVYRPLRELEGYNDSDLASDPEHIADHMSEDTADEFAEQDYTVGMIKRKIRAQGYLTGGIHWGALFKFYDRDNSGTIDWHEFRSLIRRDAKVTEKTLSDKNLRKLWDSFDVNDNETMDFREFLGFLEKDERKIEEEVDPEGARQRKLQLIDPDDPDSGYRIEKPDVGTRMLRMLELERRKVATDHSGHLSCFPCTKKCPVCFRVVLVSSWAPHYHGCRKKAHKLKDKAAKEEDEGQRWKFTPCITKRGQQAQGCKEAKMGYCLDKHGRHSIRDRKVQERMAEWQLQETREMTFHPIINDRSKNMHRTFKAQDEHTANEDWHHRLAEPKPFYRVVGKVARNMEEDDAIHKPQITFEGFKLGLVNRGDVFERLHRNIGKKDVIVKQDPTGKTKALAVAAAAKMVDVSSLKLAGIKPAQWNKFIDDAMSNKLENTSPTSTRFTGDIVSTGESAGASPSTTQFSPLTTPRVLAALTSPRLGSPLRSKRDDEGGALPVGGIAALSGRLRASIAVQKEEQKGGPPASRGWKIAQAALWGAQRAQEEEPEEEEEEPSHMVAATPKLIGLLDRCETLTKVRTGTPSPR